MRLKITIPVLIEDESEAVMRDIGINTDMNVNKCDAMTFYDIQAVARELLEDGKSISIVFISGHSFYCPLNKSVITNAIEHSIATGQHIDLWSEWKASGVNS